MGLAASTDQDYIQAVQIIHSEGHSLCDIKSKIESEDYAYLAKFGEPACEDGANDLEFLNKQFGDGTTTHPLVQTLVDTNPEELNIGGYGSLAFFALYAPNPYNNLAKYILKALAAKM